MPRMGKTEEDWKGLKLGFLKTVQPNSFSKLIPAACNFKNNAQETNLFVGSLILSFACNLFADFEFRSDWGRLIGKIKQNELDCLETAPLRYLYCGGVSKEAEKQIHPSCFFFHHMVTLFNSYPSRSFNWNVPPS